MLTNQDLTELTEFRRELHRFPELSGEEIETARKITDALKPLSPTRILTGLGGHGVAAVFDIPVVHTSRSEDQAGEYNSRDKADHCQQPARA